MLKELRLGYIFCIVVFYSFFLRTGLSNVNNNKDK